MEKRKKNHLSRQFSKGGTGTEQSGTGTTLVLSTGTGAGTDTGTDTGTPSSILTSVSMLTITWSFLIRFE